MRKLLILITIIASLFMAGCASDPVVDRLPWVHRIEIQQGNVVTQDAVDKLKPGINKRQVLFLLGTPMIADPFHADRWDYPYLLDPGSGEGEALEKRLTIFFEGDALSQIGGDYQPDVTTDDHPAHRKQGTVTVPPQHNDDQGILVRFWRWLGFGQQD